MAVRYVQFCGDMMLRLSLVAALCGAAASAAAETVYVTDSLRLGIHAAADTSDAPFANLVSGTALEVLERNSSFARVRAPDGQEGWVRASFLVEIKPALARVMELESEIVSLEAEVGAAHEAQRVAEEQFAELSGRVASTTGSAEALEDALGRLQRENEVFEERLERYRRSLPLPWVIAALVVTLIAGFLAGLWWLDALIRRRHGGFRVY
jgi:SH3 domain protein